MIGAIIGDIVGSIYEYNNHKSVDFEFFGKGCEATDDSILTIALADAILSDADYTDKLKEYVRRYPHPKGAYGGKFSGWARSDDRLPYNSLGNGSAMRTSPVGFAFDTLEDVLKAAEKYSAVTHNHPEGIKGAQATAASIFLARTGRSKDDIRAYVTKTFGYDLSRTCDQIRPTYEFNETCMKTVPEAITSFLEADDFEHAIRLAVSLGGDTDTLACITGGMAEAFFGVPEWMQTKALSMLDESLRKVVVAFRERFKLG